ncbi:MAG TPA: heavy metal translocating P-type ATPase [Deltaproteobacteria bacterium]|nr:MAG: hypothetical protein A2048_05630 [Deltaproteobacteria bacterium GWA2_45_12]HBF13976.1 heavy metal translocating P-type ATPase [Deltaproteobacteria bacterium]
MWKVSLLQEAALKAGEFLVDLGTPGNKITSKKKKRKKGNQRNQDSLSEVSPGEWRVTSDLPGRLRLKHPKLYQSELYCGQIEKRLMNMVEITKYNVSTATGGVLICYDQKLISQKELLTFLEQVVCETPADQAIPQDTKLAISSASFTFALGSALWAPWLLPVSMPIVFYTALPIFKNALNALFVEKKVKVDILDATIVGASLGMGFPAAASFMVWILDIAGGVLHLTTRQSQRLLYQALGKQAHYAYLVKDGQEIKTPVDKLNKGDIVVVNTGDHIPIDGVVTDGEAMVDQQSLTGEAAPAEKRLGEKVFAATVVVAGKVFVQVEASGDETNAAKIVKIINESATYKSKVHNMGEKFADRMVIPTFALAAAGSVIGGPQASLAIINSDFGTGIRVAAPMAVLASLACAVKHGVLIKNGRVLEALPEVHSVLFDKTGTLTHEVPEIAKIIEANGHFKEEEILRFAAAAEQRFSHPIAKAILARAEQLGLQLPPRDDSKFHVGFGIQVGINGDQIKVGSIRYMQKEGISIPDHVSTELTRIHQLGRSAIMVAVNDKLAGALELAASQRPEAKEVMDMLRKRGAKELVLISGDHQAAVREMANSLGMDRYFAEVLPQDKAKYVELLQKEGKKVAMVGDGINDSVALSKADVSISLRGASDIATDIADVVFMDGSLQKFEHLYNVSEMLKKNVNRSFKMILFPNAFCIAGAMFGVIGLAGSMVLNNGFNMIATINGMSPLFNVLEENKERSEKTQVISVASESVPAPVSVPMPQAAVA